MPTLPVPARETLPTRELPAIDVPGLVPTAPDPGALELALPAPTLPVPVPTLPLALPTLPLPALPLDPVPAEFAFVLAVPAELPASVPDVMLLVVMLDAVVDAPRSVVLLELPVPLPPEMLAVFCDPPAVLPLFALPVPEPPVVPVPAAVPFIPFVPDPEPRVFVPVPNELVVEPVARGAVVLDDEPPAPSVALSEPPEAPLLDTPAAVPAAPPLSADALAAPLELLSPEFSLVCCPGDDGDVAAVCAGAL